MTDRIMFAGAIAMLVYAVFFMEGDAAAPPGTGWECTDSREDAVLVPNPVVFEKCFRWERKP